MARECLAEESLEKRVFGVYIIRGVLVRIENLHTVSKMYGVATYIRELAVWIKDLGLIDQMFLSSPHIELIQRLPGIIVLLLELGEFNIPQDIEAIWSVLLSSQHRSMNQGLGFLIDKKAYSRYLVIALVTTHSRQLISYLTSAANCF
jgi:hypothetical protein